MTDTPTRRAEIVSFDSEPLILVNSNDEAVGEMLKADCHQGDGALHAFSLFIFNSSNELRSSAPTVSRCGAGSGQTPVAHILSG